MGGREGAGVHGSCHLMTCSFLVADMDIGYGKCDWPSGNL